MYNKQLFAFAVMALLCPAANAQMIPLDPQVKTGKLANGFTYYIRKNTQPQKRAQLYLVNKVGSLLEDDDQQGLAHFMEHMNFNGTRNFPKNQLVDYLQKAGVQFGTDLNAYTNADETVYQLPIPTNDVALVNNGLKIMRDWAQEATLNPAEIEKERGIILEEERLGKGAKDRMMRRYYPVLLNNSRYAVRIPIGMDKVLTTFKPTVIRRFYHDWYRPDLQALIVVGDIDVNEVEKIVKEKFATLKNPPSERIRPDYSIPLTGKNQFIAVTDPERSGTEMEILFKHKAPVLQTETDYLNAIKQVLCNQMIQARCIAELSNERNPDYVNMTASIQTLMGGLNMFAFTVDAKDGKLENAFRQSWRFIEKIKRFGFTPEEFEKAKKSYTQSLKTAVAEKDQTTSAKYVTEYQNHFLHNEASPGIVWEAAFVNSHIQGITLADVNALAQDYMQPNNRDILLLAPEKDKYTLPDSAAVLLWIKQSHEEELKPFIGMYNHQPLMAILPQSGKVVSKQYMPGLNITTLTLSNGIKVLLKPTTFKSDEIRFAAYSAGGTSLYSDADYDNASNAAFLINIAGLGHFNPLQLSDALNGKNLNVNTAISARKQSVSGVTTQADLETALQLTYLRFTNPRKDSTLFKNVINNSKNGMQNRYADPNNVFTDTINYVLGNYSYRTSPPSIARLNQLNMDKLYQVYKDRFADASGFTFVFTGDFAIDSITPLIEQYLGALPSLYKKEKAQDVKTDIPTGVLTKKIYKGSDNRALIRMVFSGTQTYGAINNLNLKAFGEILQIKLLQHIREEAGEVYSPTVQTIYNKNPSNQYSLTVSFGCAPKNADHLMAMVLNEIETIKMAGAHTDDIEKFKAAYVKNIELALQSNEFWTGYIIGQIENSEDLLQILSYKSNLVAVTPKSIQSIARTWISEKNLIRFELLPSGASPQ